MARKYQLRQELDESWTVYDVVDGKPVAVNDSLLVRLDQDFAADMAEILNEREECSSEQ